MRTEYLIYFLEAVKTGSFNKAGQSLGLTHQTISTGVANLENELEVELAIRDKQGIVLTPAGEAAVAYAQQILDAAGQFKQAMAPFKKAAAKQMPAGQLNVLYTPLVSILVIPYLTEVFLTKYPHIALHFAEMEGEAILQALQNKKGDLGIFAFSSIIRSDQALAAQAQPLLPESYRLCAVVAASHPLAKRKSLSVKTLLKYPLALYQAGETPGTLQKILSAQGQPKLTLVTSNLPVYEQHIATGQAIGFLPKAVKKENKPSANGQKLVYIPIKEITASPVAYALAVALSPAQKALCQLFIDEVKAMF